MTRSGTRLRVLAAAAMALLVSGCIDGIEGHADLAGVASSVAPVSPGQFVSLLGDDGVVLPMFVPTGVHNEFYLWDPGLSDAERAPEGISGNGKVVFFEPVKGSYIAQVGAVDDDASRQREYYAVRIDGNRISVSDESFARAVGAELAARLGVSGAPAPVGVLTDNAALNWAILQGTLRNRGSEIAYEDFVLKLQTTE